MYQVPLIPQDLRQEETIIQMADVLDHLNNVFGDIFGKINRRIDDNVERTRKIQNRIKACTDKIDSLVGTNKATSIVCSAKYPAMECHQHTETIFKETTNCEIVRTHREIKAKSAAIPESESQEKLEFYHVKVNNQDPVEAILEKALPRYHTKPPVELKAVGGLLVYGSEDMVYGSGGRGLTENYMVQVAKEVIERGPPSPLHDPPASVVKRDVNSTSRGRQQMYLYSPNLETVPTMDMPQDLPHLSGIAGDMRFQLDSESIIAPSARVQSLSSTPVNEVGDIQAESKRIPDEKTSTVSPSEAPVDEPVVVKPKESLEQHITPKAFVPPPPPPPPPAVVPSQPVKSSEETDSKIIKESSANKKTDKLPAPDDRANLMEAIRKAGGSGKARLRSVNAAATASKKETSNKNLSGGDLMADLHAKLSMRRKGISGARQQGNQVSILGALSAMIPPPSNNQDHHSNNSEVSSAEDDWE